ncbi:uncharacterized protein LOC141627736 [Silene latifolia]|uniref:uncharacterized protein LOC141627736 n=1 Tax=Silene latifolia TaxID=37657 RepID=UPI003D780FBA
MTCKTGTGSRKGRGVGPRNLRKLVDKAVAGYSLVGRGVGPRNLRILGDKAIVEVASSKHLYLVVGSERLNGPGLRFRLLLVCRTACGCFAGVERSDWGCINEQGWRESTGSIAREWDTLVMSWFGAVLAEEAFIHCLGLPIKIRT